MTRILDTRAGATALVGLVAAVAGWPALHADFLSDDYGYLAHLHDKPWSHFLRLFHADWSSGIWGHRLDELRPLYALTYRITGGLFGADPVGHHAFNLLIHLACALLVVELVRLCVPAARGAAIAAGCIFAAGAAHAEVLAWITGRVDGVPTLFSLAALVAFLAWRRDRGRGWLVASLAATACGLATKEIVIVVPALVVAFDVLLFRPRPSVRLLATWAAFGALAAGWMLLRYLTFGNAVREGRGSATDLVRKMLGEQPRNLEHMVWPASLAGLPPWAAIALALLPLAAAALLLRREGRERAMALLALGPAWYAITLAPLAVTYWSPRHLYMPAAGVAAALGLLLVPRERPTLGVLAAAVLVLLHGVALRHAFEPWLEWGRVSRLVREDARRLLPQVPADRLLIVDGPPSRAGDIEVWGYALPFAFEPPYVDAGYDRLRVIERPDTWCCSEELWWAARQPVVDQLRRADGPPRALTALSWDEASGGLKMRHATVDAAEVAERVETALAGRGRKKERRGVDLVVALRRLVAEKARETRDVMIPAP